MNRIKYAEQLYALISMCLGCAFIVFGLLSFIGILQPTSTSIVQSQRNIGIVFSVLGVAFLIAQAILTVLASAKKKSYYKLISNGIKVICCPRSCCLACLEFVIKPFVCIYVTLNYCEQAV